MSAMPHAHVSNGHDCSEFFQAGEDSILRAALRAGQGMAYECNAGGCGGCKFELLQGEIETLWPQAPGLSARDRQRGRHLACQSRALGPITIKARTGSEYVPAIVPQRQRAWLLGSHAITADIREFRFRTSDHAHFLPGQFAMLDLPGLNSSRAYSVANTSNAQREWHFQIRRVANGRGTEALFEALQTGDEIRLDGPYGCAYLRTDVPRNIVCVAGGSGLAPMVSIARGAHEAGLLGRRQLYFFYGARTPADVCGEDLLRALPGYGESLHYLPVVSQPDVDGVWTGRSGYVHEALVDALPGALADYVFYFAGPPPMTQALQELLMVQHQVPFDQLHFDRFF